MNQPPLIIPFQTEIYVTNNKNTPDKNCVRISPNYENVEYVSYLGGRMEPPPFSFQQPWQAGIHLHFLLPACFRRAIQMQEQQGQSHWQYPTVPDRWTVTRFVQTQEGSLSHKIFMVESNYLGLENEESRAVPWLEDSNTKHRFMGRSYEYGKAPHGTGNYMENLTAMGPGDPYFSVYYPNCFSVFGFYDDMKDVPLFSKVSYFISGFFSKESADPFFGSTEETFKDKIKEMGLCVEDKDFFSNGCVLFSQVYGIFWQGYSADYPNGKPQGEIHCGIGNTSAEVISAVIADKLSHKEKGDWERLFTMLQYEVADTLAEIDGIPQAEDEIHTRTFATKDGGNIWGFRYGEAAETLPQQAGILLAKLNQDQRAYNRKQEEIQYWQDAAFSHWYSYMLQYEGVDTPSAERDAMKQEILRICYTLIPTLRKERETLEKAISQQLATLRDLLQDTAIELEETVDQCYYQPRNPVLMLYGDGVKRSYALADGQEILCQSQPIDILTDGKVILNRSVLEKYTGEIPTVTEEYPALFFQAVCLNDDIVAYISQQEQLPELRCDKSKVAEISSRPFRQSWLTLLMEWKVSYIPSRSLSAQVDDSMKWWEFDGLDYHSQQPHGEESFTYTGRCVISPHSLYQFRYVAEKYLAEKGELTPEQKQALERVTALPALSQNMDGFNHQLMSRLQVLQPPIIGNDGDEELTNAILKNLQRERPAVNEGMPLFPLRAGHIRLEGVHIVNTFGQYQTAFSSGNPICSEVMGEYVNPNNTKFALLRPRLLQGARLRFEFVMAKDESLPACEVQEASPVCGILMPELLSGRLGFYSHSGRYYGCIRTVYRNKSKRAAWLSHMEQIETPFEQIDFENERIRSMAAFLLQDSQNGGTAFFDLMELIREQYESALPCEFAAGHDLPYIWGHPLVVTVGKVGMECSGGLLFSQLPKDYGRYNTLSVEKIGFSLFAGDRNRAHAGIVGFYEGEDYTAIYPAYNSPKRQSSYIQYNHTPELYLNGEPKTLTILSEVGNVFHFQTGLLPMLKKSLPPVFTQAVGRIKLSFETNSVLCSPLQPSIPVPETKSQQSWYFDYLRKENGTISSQRSKIVAGLPAPSEESQWICDGYLTLEQKET